MNLAVPRLLLDAADVPTCTLDPDGRITSLNPAFSRLCGRATGELVGAHAASLCTEADQPEVLTALITLLGHHAPVAHAEVSLRSVTGTSRRVRLVMGAEHLGDGAGSARIDSIVVVGRDLTADRRRDASEPGSESGATLCPDLSQTLAAARRETLETGRPYALIELGLTGPALEAADLRMAAALLVDRMRQQLRSNDTVVRHHQGACAVVATRLGDVQDAAGVCYRLLSTAMEPVEVRGEQVDLGLVAGIAVDDGSTDPEDVVATARHLEAEAMADGGGFRVRALGALAQA